VERIPWTHLLAPLEIGAAKDTDMVERAKEILVDEDELEQRRWNGETSDYAFLR
jgi:hypothetical protein